jgi:endonuclease/exonuclease/phosphatase family metal-dependent hydrolase
MTKTAVPGTRNTRRAFRLLAVTALGGALVAPLAASGAVDVAQKGAPARVMSAANRTQPAPNVFYPLPKSSSPGDLESYRAGHASTDLQAPCGTEVRSIHPGTVSVITTNAAAGPNLVKVTTTPGHLTTAYSYMGTLLVKDQQIVSAGQPVGTVGNLGSAGGCELGVQVLPDGTTPTDPTAWLESYVGRPTPDPVIFGSTGFLMSSFNVLGASHTKRPGGDAGKKYPRWNVRLPKAIAYIDSHKLDVIGLQEFQRNQHAAFAQQAGSRYGMYPSSSRTDTDNTIVWRKDTFDLVESHRFAIPYFNGKKRNMNYVLLRQRSTGRTAYFVNVHNPANTHKYHHQQKWRNKAIAIERKLVIHLRSFNRPVFLTGDLNDRSAAFCPLTKDKLMLSADSIPSFTCQPPSSLWIDWILGAGQTRFSSYTRDYSTRTSLITDHPAVYSRAYLAE